MIKVLWCRFQQCLGPFTMILLDRSSETGLLRHLSNHVFGVRNFRNTKSMSVILFSNCSKFKLNVINEEKTSEKLFCFWDNWISTGIVKLTLLRTGYLSLAANMLANSPKIWHVIKRYFFQLDCLSNYQ